MATPTSSSSPPAPQHTSRHNTDSDELPSTWSQRAWTLAISSAIFVSLATSFSLAAASSSAADLLAAAFAAFAAYSLADLATGVYHWIVDNYGDAATPVLGAQIDAFQRHHRHPSSTVYRDLCDNLHVAARAVAVVLPAADAVLYAVAGVPAAAHVFLDVLAACLALSQQFHAWAHQKPPELPPGVAALQAAGVLLSPSQHARHHRPPYNASYCIISGMWNGVLDRIRFWEALETVVYHCTGVRPRSWEKPSAKWMQHAVDGAAAS
ncbi:hypothetical protein ACP70R_012037 [Stipagrostis hirtigluma subsp. patula]